MRQCTWSGGSCGDAWGWGRLPSHRPWLGCCAKPGALAGGGAEDACPGIWKLHAPNVASWDFPTWQKRFLGHGALRWLLLSPSAQGTCLNFPFFEAGWHQLCPLQVGCQVGVEGYAGCSALGGRHGGKPGQWAGSWGCFVLCGSPQHPSRRAAVATGVCHAALAMLWGTRMSQGAINARKSERKGQMAGLCPCSTAAAQEHERALGPSPDAKGPHTTSRFWPCCWQAARGERLSPCLLWPLPTSCLASAISHAGGDAVQCARGGRWRDGWAGGNDMAGLTAHGAGERVRADRAGAGGA